MRLNSISSGEIESGSASAPITMNLPSGRRPCMLSIMDSRRVLCPELLVAKYRVVADVRQYGFHGTALAKRGLNFPSLFVGLRTPLFGRPLERKQPVGVHVAHA